MNINYNVRMKVLTSLAGAVFMVAPSWVKLPDFNPPLQEIEVAIVDPEERECLQKNIYFEARNQSLKGMKAIAAVTMNRVADPRFPDSVCEVVYQRKQFSWANRGDRNPRLHNQAEREAWYTSGEIAELALRYELKSPVGGAQYFHTTSINPGWSGMKVVTTIGDHVFKYQPI